MKSNLFLTAILCLLINTAFAQFNYLASSGYNLQGVYTDLGTNGTVIATDNFDNANSAPQNIGFTFTFNGTDYTQFILNTNGFIKLGSVAPVNTLITDVISSPETDVIAGLNMNLNGAANPEYRVFTSGVAPNRVCTIQFENLTNNILAPNTSPQFTVEFQIRLFETSNNIEIVYGEFIPGEAELLGYNSVVGIKGFDAAGSINVAKTTTSPWSTAYFIEGNYIGSTKHNIRRDVLPIPGQTYRFTTVSLVANDLQVISVYNLGKLPLMYGDPHTIQATIRNGGASTLTNPVVNLNITGANTFSDQQVIPSLAAGSSVVVNFSPFTPTNIGVNTVQVTLPADDNITNDSAASTLVVNMDTFSYADTSPSTSEIGFNTISGIISVRYFITDIGSIRSVNVFLTDNVNNVGNTVYAVVMDAAGNIVARSNDYVITANDLGAYRNFEILTPPNFSNTAFFVGLAQTANATTGYFPVGSQTEVTPTRTEAFYRGTITAGELPAETTTQGRYMIEAIVSTMTVPVKLGDLTGRLEGSTAKLQWLTYYESNTDRFEVERSLAGSGTWKSVGAVSAAGNSTKTISYHFADAGISSGNWYYRLKLIDKDAKSTYSNVVLIEMNNGLVSQLLQNYPNPVSEITRIPYTISSDAVVTFELFTMHGQKVSTELKGLQQKGSYNQSLNIKTLGLANGKYVYRLVIKDKVNGKITTLQKELNVLR